MEWKSWRVLLDRNKNTRQRVGHSTSFFGVGLLLVVVIMVAYIVVLGTVSALTSGKGVPYGNRSTSQPSQAEASR
jgi:hypothetical protein